MGHWDRAGGGGLVTSAWGGHAAVAGCGCDWSCYWNCHSNCGPCWAEGPGCRAAAHLPWAGLPGGPLPQHSGPREGHSPLPPLGSCYRSRPAQVPHDTHAHCRTAPEGSILGTCRQWHQGRGDSTRSHSHLGRRWMGCCLDTCHKCLAGGCRKRRGMGCPPWLLLPPGGPRRTSPGLAGPVARPLAACPGDRA